MDKIEQLTQMFVDVWNERDPARRRELVRTLWSPDGRHLMGDQDVRGYDALEQRVAASHLRNVAEKKYVFRPATVIQLLPGIVKFRWDMARSDTGTVVSAGIGFLSLDASGRIACDYLFTEPQTPGHMPSVGTT